MKKRYYIAYGSNLNIKQMKGRCPTAQVAGVAVLRGWQLLFKGSKTGAYLTIEEAEGRQVPVAVWEVSEEDERRLDFYEGYPSFYYKKDLTVDVRNMKTGLVTRRRAFAYIMHEDRPIGLPSIPYLQTCMEGYQDFCLDPATLLRAYLHCGELLDDES